MLPFRSRATRRSGIVPLAALAFAMLEAVPRTSGAASGSPGPESERNNWAVLVGTSRYWYNYRHTANVLTFYHTVKRMGIPDSQIILMLAEDAACNSRNSLPGTVFREHGHGANLYGESVEVDYRGDEVSVENFIRLLTGRHPPSTPRNKRLLTDSMSNILIFITGHSGEEFIKFQDWEEITSTDIADAFGQMHKQNRYRKIFWISDTCQAASLQNQFYAPEILGLGSSGKKENSYSHHMDRQLGIAVVDRFSFHAHDFFHRLNTGSSLTVANFLAHFNPKALHSHPELRSDLFSQRPEETLMTEFLAATGRMRFQNTSLRIEADLAHLDATATSEDAEGGVNESGSQCDVTQEPGLGWQPQPQRHAAESIWRVGAKAPTAKWPEVLVSLLGFSLVAGLTGKLV